MWNIPLMSIPQNTLISLGYYPKEIKLKVDFWHKNLSNFLSLLWKLEHPYHYKVQVGWFPVLSHNLDNVFQAKQLLDLFLPQSFLTEK